MKALVLTAIKQMEIQDVPRPEIADNEVLVQMKYAGICGTDKHLYNGQPGSASAVPPIILGHENAGIIVEIGSNVKNLKVGDRVCIDPNIPCGYCRYCHEGRIQLCENLDAIGVTRNGGMAEYVNVPATNAYKIPAELSYRAAAMAEPVSCVVHGLNLLDINSANSALIIGDGFIGQMFTEILANRGLASVVVSGHNKQKIPLLKELGANDVINPDEQPDNREFDLVIECVGLKSTQEQAIASAMRGGQVLMFGVAGPDDLISINPFEVYSKELTIKGAFINPYAIEDAIAILSSKMINVDRLITNELSLEEVPAVLAGKNSTPITKAVVNLEL